MFPKFVQQWTSSEVLPSIRTVGVLRAKHQGVFVNLTKQTKLDPETELNEWKSP